MRRLLEKFSKEKILKRTLPKRFGSDSIFVSPDSALKFWSYNVEKYDSTLFGWCEELIKPGATVWDVGANIGLFTFPAAFLAGSHGRVIAVEPDTFCVDLMYKSCNLRKSQRAKVDILPLAISDQLSISELCIAKRGRSANFLSGSSGSTQTGGVRELRKVMTVTLDWLLNYFPAPNVLKIDVEGFEDRVLKGALTLLREARPCILCEVSAINATAVRDYFKENNYIIYDGQLNPDERTKLEMPTSNTIAFPG